MQNKQAMKEFVVNLLKDKLPTFYSYHNYEHTLYVADKAVEIGRKENCTEKELELLHTAALWHDTGYTETYTGHEEKGCVLAKQYLPGFGYAEKDIQTVCGMIMATKIPQSPKNKLEEIIADADLEYLGTDEAAKKADDFFKELHHLHPSLTKEEWDKRQISFLQDHHYFTRYCIENKEPLKRNHLAELFKKS
jgi:HD superfamily phosphodiesterase